MAVKYTACDFVHTIQPFPFSTYIGWYLKRTGKTKLFCYDWDDLWINGLYKKPFRRLIDRIAYPLVLHTEKRFPARADAVTVCSEYLRDLARAAGSQRVFIVHNGFWPNASINKQQARTQLGLHDDSVYAGFMGRTIDELSWCFRAMQSLHEQTCSRRVRLALCGMTEDALNELPPDIMDQIDYLGQLSPANCRVFASAIDLGLMPLQNNAFNQSRFPIKYAEYQACGTPVIYSQVGECSIIDQYFDWNIAAGTTEQQFVDCFVSAMLNVLITGMFSSVKVDRLAAQLNWGVLADHLEIHYSSLLTGASIVEVRELGKSLSL
jgi:glycosyltransferase involved in cell wall biosynthesis